MVSPRSNQAGFTIIELVMAIAIMAIIAAIAVPAYTRSNDYYELEFAARQIKANVHAAQQLAQTTSQMQPILFDTTANEYVIPGVRSPDTGRTPLIKKFAGGVRRTYIESVSAPAAGDGMIMIGPDGVFDSDVTIKIRRGNNRRVIVIEQATGQITITKEAI